MKMKIKVRLSIISLLVLMIVWEVTALWGKDKNEGSPGIGRREGKQPMTSGSPSRSSRSPPKRKSPPQPAKKKNKNMDDPPPPPVVWRGLTQLDIGARTQMINVQKHNDWCMVKGNTREANDKCKQVVGYLNQLQPFRRTEACPRITNGACRKMYRDDEGKDVYQCTCNSYTKITRWRCITKTTVDSSKILLFKDCVAPGYS